MAKYIAKADLLAALRKEYRECAKDGDEYGGEAVLLAEGILSAMDTVKSFPATDVAEVVHGRWEPREDIPGFVRCSACRNCNTYDEWADGKKWSYCPNCGAKMD